VTRLLILVLTGAALLAAGCGGDDEGSSSSGGGGGGARDSSSGEAATGSAASKSGALEIDLQNFQFDPRSATVKVNQAVKWVNRDSADHDVTDEKTGQFKSERFGKGKTFEFTPKKAGTIDYVCTLHPGMSAKLTVTR
jgi:plastocyanin